MPKDSRKIIVAGVIAFVAILALATFLFSGLFAEGYAVHISGTVSFTSVVSQWGITVDPVDYKKETSPLAFTDVKLGLTATDDLLVIASFNDGDFTAQQWLKPISTFPTGGSQHFDFYVRHIPNGTHYGQIEVFEVSKNLFGLGENSRTLRATKDIQVTINEGVK